MGIVFTGEEVETLNGVSMKAVDAKTGDVVAVTVSTEALQDYGVFRVRQVAESKYDGGKREPDGSVSVKAADF